jgi:hypothetical protein
MRYRIEYCILHIKFNFVLLKSLNLLKEVISVYSTEFFFSSLFLSQE